MSHLRSRGSRATEGGGPRAADEDGAAGEGYTLHFNLDLSVLLAGTGDEYSAMDQCAIVEIGSACEFSWLVLYLQERVSRAEDNKRT